LCGGVDGHPDRRRPPQSRPDRRARRTGRLDWRRGDLRRGVPDRHHRGTARVTRLEGKIALVTGTQQGIGRSIAVALSRASADIALPPRRWSARSWPTRDFVLDVNLKGGFFCAQAAARVMVAGG